MNTAKGAVTRAPHRPAARPSPASRALGLPPVPAGPIPGYLLIADRNNDRLLIVSPSKRIVWRFPQPGDLRRGQSFHDPDDAFFTPGYRGISTNEEFDQQIAEISLRSRRIIWSYGRATAVLRLGAGTATTTVARLPVGLRYAGIAGLDGKIYVAGGLTPSGESRAVYAIDPAAGTVRLIGRLPAPVTHAPLVVLGGALYLIGGRSASGAPLAQILRIDPSSGVVSRAGILPGPLADESAVVVGGRGIVLGGDRRAASAAVLELTPKVDRLGAPS